MPRSELARPAAATRRSPGRGWARLLGVLSTFAALAAFAAGAAPQAMAIAEAEELTRFGEKGFGAGQIDQPLAVAADPTTGHVYVADTNRIDEFTPWGGFVKSYGWDVAPGAVNEQQEVRVRASGGQFKLSFGASTTADLPFNASGAEVQAALNGLASIGGAGGEVDVSAVPGTPDGISPSVYAIVFKGSLAGSDVAQLSAANGATPLSGGNPATTLEVRTRADGTAGGTGLESCTTESGCQAGLAGAGTGQLASPAGLAVDAAGNVYVKEPSNKRVQKFDSAGRFVLMFGGDVNKTKVEEGAPQAQRNRCTASSGDVCQGGSAGTGDGQFSAGQGIALGPAGELFAADNERIQRFNLEGEFEAVIPVAGKFVQKLAVDPLSGDLYATTGPGETSFASPVRKLDSATGAEIGKLEETRTYAGVAADPDGNAFAVGQEDPERIFQFDPQGKKTSEFGVAESSFDIRSLGASALGTVYVGYFSSSLATTYFRAFGPGPTPFEAPPPAAPEIAAQYATSVGRDDAVVGAEINPNFWTDTRFYVQYGTGKCSEGGCTAEKPLPPGALLTARATNALVKTAGVALEGLADDTAYHYRFVAESSGGGPTVGEEASFTTYPQVSPQPACPNDALRFGLSSRLPDCRAYEMVSPVDKNNGDILALPELTGNPTEFTQGSSDGSRFTFSSYRAFANPTSAPFTSQYLASREAGGWSTRSITAPRGSASSQAGGVNAYLQNEFKAFSADLCHAWEVVAAEPVLAPGAPLGYYELYRRDNCGTVGYEPLAKAEPTGQINQYLPELQGLSTDGGSAVFRVKEELTPEASTGAIQAYYTRGGGISFLCVLPDGTPFAGNCSAGTTEDFYKIIPSDQNRYASVANALSQNGDRAYWTASEGPSGAGRVYLRLNPGEPQSAIEGAQCTEPEKACTLKISETKSNRASIFLGASTDGSRALFQVTEGPAIGKLFLFTLGGGTREIATAPVNVDAEMDRPHLVGVVGTSDSLSDVYFVSEQVLPGTSGASTGEPNLYLDSEGTRTFIATLSQRDVAVGKGGFRLVASSTAPEPTLHLARASADGTSLAFVSDRPLTGYDNVDQASGKPDSEVYLFDTDAQQLRCISCNPSGARPRGRETGPIGGSTKLPTAASLHLPTFQLQKTQSLSADGARLFFDSYDALLPADTNGKRDVYEWQAASGKAQCKAIAASIYSSIAGGCISLISSGESPQDSSFLDATPGGGDVFFSTSASLVSQDPGLIDVYDARVGGGFPTPQGPQPCEGEACQGSSTPPSDPALSSATFKGAGNATPPRRCRKGRVMRRGRCVAKRKARHGGARRKATDNRRKSR